jgi:hypothetical protein
MEIKYDTGMGHDSCHYPSDFDQRDADDLLLAEPAR